MDVNEDDLPFVPSTLEGCEKEVDELRMRYMFGIEAECAEPMAEQHYLLALSLLEQAQRHFAIARLHQVRALADLQLGRR